jgi:hypothetical protein
MSRIAFPLAATFALALLALAPSHQAVAKTLEVGPDKPYKQPSAAIAAAAEGDTIAIAPGEYFDCAVVSANRLTIQGTGPDASAVLTDKSCAGKGMLVTDGNDITIRNLTLTRARVPDGNGAGIRAEGVNLTVDHVKFINNQNGILANPVANSVITIRDSEFIRNGSCDGGCAHGVYAGDIKQLRIERSRFSDTRRAHHIKSRALLTEVIGCNISDGPEGTASYLVEIPNGGAVLIRDNTMEKGPKAENHTAAIMIGSEGVTHRTPEITIANNTFRNAGNYSTFFVVNMTATEAMLTGNKLSGQVDALKGDGVVK